MNGNFIISLDFEIHWGVFDTKSIANYRENLINVGPVIQRLLELSEFYNVKLTFATVGFLFAKDKAELITYSPANRPTYENIKYDPYQLISTIGNDEHEDPFHYALSLIQNIKSAKRHEISTHTFCHYYCHALGQTVSQFEADLKSAIAIAKPLDLSLKSIVFPRNMIETSDTLYLEACYRQGLRSFRGKEKAFVYNINTNKFYKKWYIFKIIRLLDTYINVTGSNTYKTTDLYTASKMLNIPSSRLLRPYSNKLKVLEPLKIRRIKKAMTYAAKHNETYHLWWHPHNFGSQTEENFKNLESIFKTYAALNQSYNFKSETMSSLTDKTISGMS